MKGKVKKLYDELQEDLAFYEELGEPPANRLSGALVSIRARMVQLKVLVMTEGFRSLESEIVFFKRDKPLFVAEQVYLTEYTVIVLGRPMSGSGMVEAYYLEELKRIQTFINRFGFLYQCYKWTQRTSIVCCFYAMPALRACCCRRHRTPTLHFPPTAIFCGPSLWPMNAYKPGWKNNSR